MRPVSRRLVVRLRRVRRLQVVVRLSLVSVKGDLPAVAMARVAGVVSRAPLRLLLVSSASRAKTGLQSRVLRLPVWKLYQDPPSASL